MSRSKKIEYYDLREEALAGTLPIIIGREEEMERLTRTIGRRSVNNMLVVGESGIGKTALVYGWVRDICRKPAYESLEFLQFDVAHLYALESDERLEEVYGEALHSLPSSVICIDDFGRELAKNIDLVQHFFRLYKRILKRPDVHIVLMLEPHEYTWIEQEFPAFLNAFETLQLKNQSPFEHQRILGKALPRLNARHRILVPDSALAETIAYAERFPMLGQLPRSAIRILDEAISHSASQRSEILMQSSIAHVVEAKTGIPKAKLTEDELESTKRLEETLNARIINQASVIQKIATTLQRAKLGLRNPNRPLGSFLLLGPSGVGKTETAKTVAEIIFGRAENFIRFDMSEFQQDHTAQRLIGAPAGYIGYGEGGALTNALSKEPHSLILLDEIEKAHSKVFDVFLQVLDDGRLTSGQNETVDARNTIIMATSNAAVREILEAYEKNEAIDEETLLKDVVLPALATSFRSEFINRFDGILIFKPLTFSGLLKIAELELKKTEKRLAKHRVRFEVEPKELERNIRRLVDPRFGARPVKRFIEDTCETLLVASLLNPTA